MPEHSELFKRYPLPWRSDESLSIVRGCSHVIDADGRDIFGRRVMKLLGDAIVLWANAQADPAEASTTNEHWRCEANDHGEVYVLGSDGRVIAELVGDLTVSLSNGRFIASAPDMARRIAELEAVNAELVASCESWVRYMDSLDADSGNDPLAEARRHYHGKRMEQTRAAIATAKAVQP